MFKETSVQIENLPGPILDLDLQGTDGWIAICGDENAKHLSFSGKTIPFKPSVDFPIVRALGPQAALVINARTDEPIANAFIVEASGATRTAFFAGDGIQDVLTSRQHIVITYFDEGVFGGGSLANNGVAVLDHKGNLVLGYLDEFGKKATDASDCYAASWDENGELVFFAYADFPIVKLDILNRQQRIIQTPKEIAGSHAISPCGKWIYFAGRYHDPYSVFRWELGANTIEKVGEIHTKRLRGLPGGKFFSVGTAGYSVTSVGEV